MAVVFKEEVIPFIGTLPTNKLKWALDRLLSKKSADLELLERVYGELEDEIEVGEEKIAFSVAKFEPSSKASHEDRRAKLRGVAPEPFERVELLEEGKARIEEFVAAHCGDGMTGTWSEFRQYARA